MYCSQIQWADFRFIDASNGGGAGRGKLKIQSSKLKRSSRLKAPKAGIPSLAASAKAFLTEDSARVKAQLRRSAPIFPRRLWGFGILELSLSFELLNLRHEMAVSEMAIDLRGLFANFTAP